MTGNGHTATLNLHRGQSEADLLAARYVELGKHLLTGESVPIQRSLLNESHMHILGATRQGKTAQQRNLCGAFQLPYLDELGQVESDTVVVLDGGGDLTMFHDVKETAESLGRRFRFLSLEPGVGEKCDPFQLTAGGESNAAIILCNFLTSSLGVEYGTDAYGPSYFRARNLSALKKASRQMLESKKKPTLELLKHYLEKSRVRDADEAIMAVDFLTEFDCFRPPFDPAHSINYNRAIEKGEVIYLFVPTDSMPMARLVARFNLFLLLQAARYRRTNGLRMRPVRVFIDEFQELVSYGLASALVQAGKNNISLILSNQSTQQLVSRDMDLRPVINDNCVVRLRFSPINRDDCEELQSHSKDEPRPFSSESIAPNRLDVTETIREVEMPKLHKNDVLDVVYTKGAAYATIMTGAGHGEPIPLLVRPRLDRETYLRFRSMPLPGMETDDGTEDKSLDDPLIFDTEGDDTSVVSLGSEADSPMLDEYGLECEALLAELFHEKYQFFTFNPSP